MAPYKSPPNLGLELRHLSQTDPIFHGSLFFVFLFGGFGLRFSPTSTVFSRMFAMEQGSDWIEGPFRAMKLHLND